MKNLTTTNKQVTETVKEEINGQEVFYQFNYDENNPTPQVVNFSTQNGQGKMIHC